MAKHVTTHRLFGQGDVRTKEQLANLIEHALPKPDLTKEDTKRLYEETKKWAFGLFVLTPPMRH